MSTMVVVRYMRYPDEAGSLSAVLNGVFGVLAKNGLRLGRDLTMALKTLIQAEQIVHTLDTTLDITKAALRRYPGLPVRAVHARERQGDRADPGAALGQGTGAPHPRSAAGDHEVDDAV